MFITIAKHTPIIIFIGILNGSCLQAAAERLPVRYALLTQSPEASLDLLTYTYRYVSADLLQQGLAWTKKQRAIIISPGLPVTEINPHEYLDINVEEVPAAIVKNIRTIAEKMHADITPERLKDLTIKQTTLKSIPMLIEAERQQAPTQLKKLFFLNLVYRLLEPKPDIPSFAAACDKDNLFWHEQIVAACNNPEKIPTFQLNEHQEPIIDSLYTQFTLPLPLTTCNDIMQETLEALTPAKIYRE